MVAFAFDRKVALFTLLAAGIFAGLTASWVPLFALHQDFDTALLPAATELEIPLLVEAPLVLGGEVDLVASTLEGSEDVVFRLFYNDRLIAESERHLEISFTIEELRASPSSLVLVAAHGEPMPVTIHYSAGALRPASGLERLLMGALLFSPLSAPLAVRLAVLRPEKGATRTARRSSVSLFLTGWVFFLYLELLVGLPLLGFNFDLGALRSFFGSLLLLSVRTPFGLLPTLSAAGGLALVLSGETAPPTRPSRLSLTMGAVGIAILFALLILSPGLGR